jgi:hypothetical protein
MLVNALALYEVEHGPSFVNQEYARRIRKPPSEREQLLLATAQLVRIPIGQVTQSQGVQ